MSLYQFLPSKPMNEYLASFVTWRGAFTDTELDEIVKYCDANLLLDDALVGDTRGEVVKDIRKSKVGWIHQNKDTDWLYSKLAWVSRELNNKFYNFNLYGFVEDFQYTVYSSEYQGHYDWHIDATYTSTLPRKFSIILQLSDPASYEGGELLVKNSNEEQEVLKEKGLIAGFPSYTLHKVNPVLKGERKTLVIWIGGPAFR